MAVFFEALRNNDIDQIYELAQGNDINEVVTYGGYVQTPLIYFLRTRMFKYGAKKKKNSLLKVLRCLLEIGADPNTVCPSRTFEVMDPLYIAMDEQEFFVMLMDHHANFIHPGRKPEIFFERCIRANLMFVLDYLLQSKVPKTLWRTYFISAITRDRIDMVRRFVECGLDIHSELIDKNLKQTRFYITKAKTLRMFKFFVEQNCDVNAQNILGETALVNMCSLYRSDCIAYLIHHGATVNLQVILAFILGQARQQHNPSISIDYGIDLLLIKEPMVTLQELESHVKHLMLPEFESSFNKLYSYVAMMRSTRIQEINKCEQLYDCTKHEIYKYI